MLADIKGVGEKTILSLHELGIHTATELLYKLPKSYLDLSKVTPLECAADGSFCLVDLIIEDKKELVFKGKLKLFKATGKLQNICVNLIWYNRTYVSKLLEKGKVYTFYGKLKIRNFCYEFNNPLFAEKSEISKFQGIQPIYSTRGLINQKNYWNIVKEALKTNRITSIINDTVANNFHLLGLNEAFNSIHNPFTVDVKAEKDRIMLESLVRRMAAFRLAKSNNSAVEKYKYFHKFALNDYVNILPFELNNSQALAIQKISNIITSAKPLNSILCGDVGSGKTIVALLSALFVKSNGYQSAIMAPTEILALQHFHNLTKLCSTLDVKIAFLSSSTKSVERNKILSGLSTGAIDIIIGTHSILNKEIQFDKLAFVVVDEQHRFGVAQRTCLIYKGKNVDVLTLSATPIPRSLQLAAYGDIDYISIDRRFDNNTITAVVTPPKRPDMWKYLYSECIEKSGQAFVVAPKIVDAEGIEIESVQELYKELTVFFPLDKIAMLHGKLGADKKQSIIKDFSENKISVLVSTTVVEVGIDVPNANFMVIMEADSFGLATLHQLRGRVGRGGKKAFCFLYTAKELSEGLKLLTKTCDGAEIAEKDFELRGSGDILGLEQSGEGSLQGLTVKNLLLAKEITEKLNLEALRGELTQEILNFSLDCVSFT